MTAYPLLQGIPVDNLYEDQDTEVYNRLLYAASQLLLLWLGMRAREDNGSAA